MQRILVSALSVLLVANSIHAQTVAERLASVEAHVAAGKLEAALDVLLQLADKADSDVRSKEFGRRLQSLGEQLQASGRFEMSLRAHQGALALCTKILGGRDDLVMIAAMNNVAMALEVLGRHGEALPMYGECLSMARRMAGGNVDAEVLGRLNNLGRCLVGLGRLDEGLARFEESLVGKRGLLDGRDDDDLIVILSNIADCHMRLGHSDKALPRLEEALMICERLHDGQDHELVMSVLNNLATCQIYLGHLEEGLARLESGLAMSRRMFGESDHPIVASFLNNVAYLLLTLGRTEEALARHEETLAMKRRMFGGRDHPSVAASMDNVGACLQEMGRSGDALPLHEAALAMFRRIHGDEALMEIAQAMHNAALCLSRLGRAQDSLARSEGARRVFERVLEGRDHPKLAASLSLAASNLQRLQRAREALPVYEAALNMVRRLCGDRDHIDHAASLSNLASCLHDLGRSEEAISHQEEVLAMFRRIHGGRDHMDVATIMNNLAAGYSRRGQSAEALETFEAVVAMHARLNGELGHPEVAASLSSAAACLANMGRTKEAWTRGAQAVEMIERLRNEAWVSGDLRQSLFDELKSGGAYERMQALAVRLGDPAESMRYGERSRSRELIDLLEQQTSVPEEEAARRALERGDREGATRIIALRAEVQAARQEGDRLLRQLTKLGGQHQSVEASAERRRELLVESDAASQRLRQLLDERARLLGDVLPVGRVRTVPQIQAVLQPGELFLQFTVAKEAQLLLVLGHEGDVQAWQLPAAGEATQQLLERVVAGTSRLGLAPQRGRDPEDRPQVTSTSQQSLELFRVLFPGESWQRVQASRRVFIAAHRGLHRLPFESLVTNLEDGKPVHWLENGPPISYVPSGSVLHWLRNRAGGLRQGGAAFDVLAVGDPALGRVGPQPPEQGVLVRTVADDGEAARVGLQPFDVIVSYDGKPIADDASLREARTAIEAAIEIGQRAATAVAIEVWRAGELRRMEVKPGKLGITVGQGTARGALAASDDQTKDASHFVRKNDLERMSRLPQLSGARAEAEAVAAAFREKNARAAIKLGAEAREAAVNELAPRAKYVHFACHGLAEEYAGQSLSMLVLAQPEELQPGDDGLLKLTDLLHDWRGRLTGCRLVVLSACRTNVGPLFRDEAPHALPIGFLFAGVPSVISSLWAVDDASTRDLMVDFYARLLAGETDKLAAFTAAKKALRQKYPDPFHWAAFLFLGIPE